jgi:anti-sigma regulatory factor (Ser/Thr protein kinase)
VYLVIDPATETLELVNAGHPPALVVDPSGEAHFLWPKGGVPLGATGAATYEAERFPLPTGATVLIYTDGLVERRGESIEVGLERLREIAKGARDPESLCVTICERLVPEEPEDDVAFIATRMPPLGDHVSTTWRVSPDSLAPIRYLLRRWLMNRGASEQHAYDIIVAAQEACANAVEHAYGPGSAEFEVDLRYEDGRVTITVTDHGQWRPPRGENRGRGLPLMHTLMDEVDVRHTDEGTSVKLISTLQ